MVNVFTFYLYDSSSNHSHEAVDVNFILIMCIINCLYMHHGRIRLFKGIYIEYYPGIQITQITNSVQLS